MHFYPHIPVVGSGLRHSGFICGKQLKMMTRRFSLLKPRGHVFFSRARHGIWHQRVPVGPGHDFKSDECNQWLPLPDSPIEYIITASYTDPDLPLGASWLPRLRASCAVLHSTALTGANACVRRPRCFWIAHSRGGTVAEPPRSRLRLAIHTAVSP